MINQPIELGGKRGARIDVASRAQDAAGIELERKRNVLRADVIQAFYNQRRLSKGCSWHVNRLSSPSEVYVLLEGVSIAASHLLLKVREHRSSYRRCASS